MTENKVEKSLRYVVNLIPDFEPKSEEEKILIMIKRYCQAGADEIKRLEAENAEIKARLEKAVELPFIIHVSNNYAVIVYVDENGKIHKTHTYATKEAEARLAELKGGLADEL